MKIGICFGGYCPLHQGHMDLIMQAKKENDKCLVIVCGYEGEPRADEIGLTLERRKTLVKKMFNKDEQIVVASINDTKLGIEDESLSDHNWLVWMSECGRILCSKSMHATEKDDAFTYKFYVAEPNYKTSIDTVVSGQMRPFPFNSANTSVTVCEKVNNVSGTLIRENPIKYWNKIAQTFRPYFSTNILITGTASEGKSTLTKDIARYFGIPYSEEYGRTYMEVNAKCDTDLTVNDFIEFLIEQRRDTKNKIESAANGGIVISDTDNLVTLMYAAAYVEDDNIDLSNDDFNKILMPLAKTLQRGITWDKIYLLPPKNNFVDDGCRYMAQSSIEERIKNFTRLNALIDAFGWHDKVEVLDGNYLENFNTVKSYIENKYNFNS